MKRISDFDKIEVGSRVEFPKAGGYIGVIMAAKDVPNREYLELLVDIADGEYKNFYRSWYDNTGTWLLRGYCSYKSTALKPFKGFTKSVEESNKGYVWDFDESTLVGKKVGIILREEQYEKADGTIGDSLKIYGWRNVDVIHKGNFKVPEKLVIEPKPKTTTTKAVDLSGLNDIQF